MYLVAAKEEKKIAEEQFRRKQLEKELELLDEKIKQAAKDPDFKLDAPEGTSVKLSADIGHKDE